VQVRARLREMGEREAGPKTNHLSLPLAPMLPALRSRATAAAMESRAWAEAAPCPGPARPVFLDETRATDEHGPHPWPAGDTVVMDNLGSHKVEGVREAIEARG
jgi:hypothetical protein